MAVAKKTKKKVSKTYRVNLDMKVSLDYVIKAKTIGEAKAKAWLRFKRGPGRGNFELLADRED